MTNDYCIEQQNDKTWNVYLLAPSTGDKRDVLSNHQTRTQALAAIDRYRAADMRRYEERERRITQAKYDGSRSRD